MKISKKSYHYRWYRTINSLVHDKYDNLPTNLCNYFWGFIGVNIIGLLLLLLASFTCFAILSPIILIITLFITKPPEDLFGVGIVTGAMETVALVIIGTRLVFEKFENKKDSFLNVTNEYVKAKKQNICPLIEFTE